MTGIMWHDPPSMVNGMICGIGLTWFYHVREWTMRSLKLREGHFPLGAILNIVRWGMVMVESTLRSTKWATDSHVVPSHGWLRTDFPEWISQNGLFNPLWSSTNRVFFHAATAQVEPENSTGSSHTLKIPLQRWIIWDVGFFRNGGNLQEYGHSICNVY